VFSTHWLGNPPQHRIRILMQLTLCSTYVVQAVGVLVLRSTLETIERAEEPPLLSALHEVVGHDGVLMIHLDRIGRKQATNPRLHEVGIYPTIFPAVDVDTTSPDDLREGCISAKDASHEACKDRSGYGCHLTIEQAIAESHRRALLVAKDRNSTWTAIFEDDAVPVDQTNFNTNFRKVWGQVPEGVGYVRLGWCPFTHDEQTTNFTYDHFRLVSGLPVGGCTTAYMVHRDIIPTLLGLFPCCSSLDACLNSDLFATPSLCGQNNTRRCWGQEYLMGIDTLGSISLTKGWASFVQNGILVQDNRKSKSIKHRWKVNRKRKRAQQT